MRTHEAIRERATKLWTTGQLKNGLYKSIMANPGAYSAPAPEADLTDLATACYNDGVIEYRQWDFLCRNPHDCGMILEFHAWYNNR